MRIYQGENSDALENIQLGEFRVEGLSDAPAGNPIILDLALDRDGILHVSAREKTTGLERRITIDKAMSRYDKNELESARQRIGALFGEEGEPPPPTAPEAVPTDAALDALLAKARAKLDEAGEEDRTELIDLIESVGDFRDSGDGAGLAEARQQLSDLLFYLET